MNRKKMILLTSLLTLLPMLLGLLLWNRLPEEMPIHFNSHGEVDDWGSKAFVVFFLPLFLFVMHLITGFITLHDPKKQNIGDKIFLLILFIIPSVAVLECVLTYGSAFGIAFSPNMLGNLFLGIIFTIVGNYLPKSRQNYTVGIKLPWTLNDAENWNKTHRFAGILWTLCGILLLINTFVNLTYLPIGILLCAALLPCVYSFVLYTRKQKED